MARTTDQIYNAIIAEKESRPELAGLTSVSATAVWRLLAFVVATVVWLHEKMFDQYTLDLQTLADNSIVGSGRYYVTAMLEFQEGDTLVVLPSGRLGYNVIDAAKRIIKLASFQEQPGGVVLIKVAALSGTAIQPLTAAQRTQAQGYARKIGFAGVRTNVISETADKLRVFATVYYNALIDIAVMRAGVEAAIGNYLKNLDFDGAVYASKLQDAIQSVPGVEDIRITLLTGVSGLGAQNWERIYRTRAGYIGPDTAPGLTFADTITYTAQ